MLAHASLDTPWDVIMGGRDECTRAVSPTCAPLPTIRSARIDACTLVSRARRQVRVLMSIACGSLIGFERRRADRAAGIRTMALVCLGSCVFTIASIFAFIGGPMAWDASRVSAAIPSGVGFLGAASIWKGTRPNVNDGTPTPEVHGLTTATSVWLSSAVGILAGGALYAPAIFTTAIAVVYLRFAPRLHRGLEGDPKPSPNLGNKPTGAKKPSPLTKPASFSKSTGDMEAALRDLKVPLMQDQPPVKSPRPSVTETQLML